MKSLIIQSCLYLAIGLVMYWRSRRKPTIIKVKPKQSELTDKELNVLPHVSFYLAWREKEQLERTVRAARGVS